MLVILRFEIWDIADTDTWLASLSSMMKRLSRRISGSNTHFFDCRPSIFPSFIILSGHELEPPAWDEEKFFLYFVKSRSQLCKGNPWRSSWKKQDKTSSKKQQRRSYPAWRTSKWWLPGVGTGRWGFFFSFYEQFRRNQTFYKSSLLKNVDNSKKAWMVSFVLLCCQAHLSSMARSLTFGHLCLLVRARGAVIVFWNHDNQSLLHSLATQFYPRCLRRAKEWRVLSDRSRNKSQHPLRQRKAWLSVLLEAARV